MDTDQITETNEVAAGSEPAKKAEASVEKATAPKKKSTRKTQSNGFDVVTDVKAEIMISINYSDICSLEVSVYGH